MFVLGLLSIGLESSSLALQGIVADEAHHISNGLKHEDKDYPKNEVTIDPSQDVAKLHPALVGQLQQSRRD